MPFFNLDLLVRILVFLLGPISALGLTEVELIKDNFLTRLLPTKSSSYQSNSCYKDLSEVAWGIFRLEGWALKMIDAAGKPEAGILEGNVGWVGSYEQCLGIKKGSVEGQHCWVKMVIENATFQIGISLDGIQLIGICVPNSCKNKDFRPITNSINEMLPNKMIASVINVSVALFIDCEYDHFVLDLTSFSALVICCTLLVFVIVGTSIDLLRRKTHLVPFYSFLSYFSLYSNGRKLFVLEDQKRTTFGELNGLKVIATAYIIFLHTLLYLQEIVKDLKILIDESGPWFAPLVFQRQPMAIFFLITGFLTFNGVVRKPPTKGNKCYFIVSFILKRYIKSLVAPALIVFIFQVAFQPFLSSGPLWKSLETPPCGRNTWWKNALFISNWWPMGDMCFGPWWFLSASVQLHLLSLLIVIPFINKRYRMCIWSASAMLVLSWCWLAWKDILQPLYPQGNHLSQYFTFGTEAVIVTDQIYQTPYYNLGPYLTGMGLAGFLFNHKDRIILTKKQTFFGWILSSTFLFLSLYAIYLRPNRMLRNMHNTFGNTMYSVFIAWIVLVCYNREDNGIVSSVLRWRYWLPLSKLSLCAYLLQKTVIEYFYYSEMDKMNFSWISQFVFFLRHWTVTYSMSVMVILTIEMPINALVDSFLISIKKCTLF